MNKIKSSLAITISKYPWIKQEDLIRLYLEYIESEYINIIKKNIQKVQIPDQIYLKQLMFKERRKQKRIRKTNEEIERKKILIKWLREIKAGERRFNVIDQDAISFEWENIRSNSAELDQQNKLIISTHSNEIAGIPDWSNPETEALKDKEKTNSNESKDLLLDISEEKENKLKAIIKESTENALKDIKKYYNNDFGYITEVTLDQNDDDALKTWLIIADKINLEKLDEKVIVNWTKENKLNDEEIMKRIIEIMLKLNMGPKRTDRFDANNEIYMV